MSTVISRVRPLLASSEPEARTSELQARYFWCEPEARMRASSSLVEVRAFESSKLLGKKLASTKMKENGTKPRRKTVEI